MDQSGGRDVGFQFYGAGGGYDAVYLEGSGAGDGAGGVDWSCLGNKRVCVFVVDEGVVAWLFVEGVCV